MVILFWIHPLPRKTIDVVERLKFNKEKIKVFSKGKSLDRKIYIFCQKVEI